MKKFVHSLILAILILGGASLAYGQSYSTNFPTTQNPISESGNWANFSSNAGNQITSPGYVIGLEASGGDSLSILTSLSGPWAATQMAMATVRIPGATPSGCCFEVALHLHMTGGSTSSTGYEVFCSVSSTSNYFYIARWDAGGGFAYVDHTNGTTQCRNGDIIKVTATPAGLITGYLNGVQEAQGTDATYTSGTPGIGFFLSGAGSSNSAYGFSNFCAGTTSCSFSGGTTFTAASCNQADVNGLINNTGGSQQHQAVDGDTIIIPAGSCTWNAGITVPDSIGITMMGSGTQNTNSVCTATSQVGCGAGTPTTVITDSAGGSHMIVMTPTFGNSTARLSTIQFLVGSTTTQAVSFGGHCTASGCPNIRVDNLVVPPWTVGTLAFSYMTNVFGVMDHNTVNYINTTGIGTNETFVDIGHGHFAGSVSEVPPVNNNWGDSSYASADTFGTQQTLYLENNLINGQVATDTEGADGAGTWGGARFVCRFNYFPVIQQNGGCTAHGTDTGGRIRGVRQWEMYGNYGICTQFDVPNNKTLNCNSFAPTRGGVGRVWNNKVVPGATPAGQGGFLKSLGTTDTQRTWRLLGIWGSGNNNQCNGQSAWDNNDGVTYYPPSGTATITAVSDSTPSGFNQWFVTVAAPGGGSPGWTVNQWGPASVTDWDYEFVDVSNAAHPNFGYLITSNTANVLALQNDGNGAGGTPVIGDSIQILRAKVCLDQMGRSGGVLVRDTTNLSAVPVLTTTGVPGPVNESLDPSYEANDSLSATSVSTVPSSGNVVVLRDTMSETVNQAANGNGSGGNCNGVSCVPFNGANGQGAGHGLLTNRPNCTSGPTCVVGAGYLATDQGSWNSVSGGIQGIWYHWNGTSWVSELVLQYPHPLITGGGGGSISFNPPSLSFGGVSVGVPSASQTTVLSNTTPSFITITGTTFSPSVGFSQTNNCPSTLANGAFCTFTVTFTPSASGAVTSTMSTAFTGVSGSPATVGLSGTGTLGAPLPPTNFTGVVQ